VRYKENLEVYIEYYSNSQPLNEQILKESVEFRWVDDVRLAGGGSSNVKASQTEEHIVVSPSIKVIYEWVFDRVRTLYPGWKYYINAAWLTRYDKGHYTVSHDHIPASFSFVYFIKCPKGSAPLVFTTSGKRIKAEEGKVLIFPGNMKHHVPKNKGEGRMVLAGNIGFVHG
jgi:hypothetical protein